MDKLFTNKLYPLRLLFVVAIIGIISNGYLVNTHINRLYDPIWLRLIVCIPITTVFFLTFSTLFVEKYLYKSFYIVAATFFIWVEILLYFNNLDLHYIYLWIIGLVGSALGIKTINHFKCFVLTILTITLLTLVFLSPPLETTILFIQLVIYASLVAFLIIGNLLNYQNKLERSNEQLEKLNQEFVRREAEVRSNRLLFLSVFEKSADAIFLIDAETKTIKDCNNRALDIFDTSSKRFLKGKEISICLNALRFEEINNEISTSGYWSRNINFQTCKNASLWGNVAFTDIEDRRGEKLYLLRITDITTRKLNEEELKKAKDRFELAVAGSKAGIWDWDIKSGQIYFSGGLQKLLGYKEGELENRSSTVYNLMNEEDIPEIKENLSQYLNQETGEFESEVRLKHRSGKYKWYLIKGAALWNEWGSPNRFTGSLTDINDLKAAEERLTIQNAELKKVNFELDKFVYSVSHDLRAPITSAIGLINIFKMTDNAEEQKKYMALLEKSMYKLDDFIKDIISISRNSRMEIDESEIDFHSLVTDLYDELRYMKQAKYVETKLYITGDVRFFTDKTRLSIILSNLISNAIRYSFPEKNKSWVETHIDITQEKTVIKRSPPKGRGIVIAPVRG
ncbi:PAS domain-containing sensor histidine kinase [Flammeovirgaceae bacterium SG7u.111]|nr:PAS domain-containing sensor histidine kinase [Flammeovirgaceae bacterium SG7u.132]WPO35564.1 PAS domain-containing sensor histidine kinase [Flammeovirgaceae bacterium SG7u.111]